MTAASERQGALRKIFRRSWIGWVVVSLAILCCTLLAIFWPSIRFELAVEVPEVVSSGGQQFRLSPPPATEDGQAPELSFIVVGDTGTGASTQRDVAKAMATVAKERRSAFVLMLGDNFYESGVESVHDRQWQLKFEMIYRSRLRKIPFYACLGNHDHRGNVDAQIDYSNISERWRMPARYYKFTQPIPGAEGLLVEFFVIDTEPIALGKDESRSQLAWLEREILASGAHWKIIAGHHPLRSGGRPSSATKTIRKALMPVLERAPIDLYLSGHDHYLEFGTADQGINYAISGAGGKLQRRVVGHRFAESATKQLGFVMVNVNADRLQLRMIGLGGELPQQKVIRKRE